MVPTTTPSTTTISEEVVVVGGKKSVKKQKQKNIRIMTMIAFLLFLFGFYFLAVRPLSMAVAIREEQALHHWIGAETDLDGHGHGHGHGNATHTGGGAAPDPDKDCPFRASPLYRKVFVYPNFGDVDHGWSGSILSPAGQQNTSLPWPWLEYDNYGRQHVTYQYDINSNWIQYSTELIVREIFTNPRSCLRTDNPDAATLFYVPYLPAMERFGDKDRDNVYFLSPFALAITEILDHNNYTFWENTWGLTSDYWKRRGGSDHVLVFSEPLHGLRHDSWRGTRHMIKSQKQLAPPIIVSVELSTTFVSMFPKCAAKNILMPYPNPDGRWFNGHKEQEARTILQQSSKTNLSTLFLESALPSELERMFRGRNSTTTTTNNNNNSNSTASSSSSHYYFRTSSSSWWWWGQEQEQQPRPLSHYYFAFSHGGCVNLRNALKADYRNCLAAFRVMVELQQQRLRNSQNNKDDRNTTTNNSSSNNNNNNNMILPYSVAMRLATFCPCPHGDSPSAKRMFDSILSGCIPVILSTDFVWPFTSEWSREEDMDTKDALLDASEFSIRLNSSDYVQPSLDPVTCQPMNPAQPGLEAYLRSLDAQEIARLRRGLVHAADVYSYYQPRPDLPDHLLLQRVLPDGGAAHALVRALADRAGGVRWPACQNELRGVNMKQAVVPKFKC